MSLKLTDKSVVLINATLVRSRTRAFISPSPFTKHTGSISVLLHYFRKNNVIRVVWFLSNYRILIIISILHQGRISPVLLISTHMRMPRMLPSHDSRT